MLFSWKIILIISSWKQKKTIINKNGKMKYKGKILVGLIAILPIVLVYEVIDLVPDWIYNPIKDVLEVSEFLSKILGLCVICVVLWAVGGIINGEMGTQLKQWVSSMIKKIPVIGYLFRVVSQMLDTIKYTNSFKEVVLIRIKGGFFVCAYISHEHEGYLWLHVPSLPAPWTGPIPLIVKADAVIRTDIKVRTLLDSVITLGTSQSTEEIISSLKAKLKEEEIPFKEKPHSV